MTATLVLRWTFEVELDGESAYVVEKQDGGACYIRHGPMPRDFAGPFIDERKEQLELMAIRAKADLSKKLAAP